MAFDPVHGLVPGRFNRRQLILGSSAAAVLAAALAACGSDDNNSSAPGRHQCPGGDGRSPGHSGRHRNNRGRNGTTPAAAGKEGGILRVGTLGGANDIIDGQHIVAKADIMRQVTGWEPLMAFDADFVPGYDNALAKDVTAKAADDFVITLKDDIKFGNGNPVTADDVVYSFTRLIDPDLALYGGSVLRTVLDKAGIIKVDDRTVELKLKQGVSNFKETLCAYTCAVVPVGYERFSGDPEHAGRYRRLHAQVVRGR